MPDGLRDFGVREQASEPERQTLAHFGGTPFAAVPGCRATRGGGAMRDPRGLLLGVCLFALAAGAAVRAQTFAPSQPTPTAPAAEQPRDALGRSTPRGTVLGFLTAARRGDTAIARQYLNTRLNDKAAEELARQLFLVLDARLAARLTQLSDAPEGSRANPQAPDQEVVGTIARDAASVEIVVERVEREKSGPIWLFSGGTLDAVPGLYQQLATSRAEAWLPRVLFDKRVASVRLLDWLAVLLGLPVLYLATSLLNRLLTPLVRLAWRRLFRVPDEGGRNALPAPARLLLLAVVGRFLLPSLPLSLLLAGVPDQRGHSPHHHLWRLAAGAPQRRGRSARSAAGFPRPTPRRFPCCESGGAASTCS